MTPILTPAERVRNGARWLDENFPGWMDRIDPDTLQLNSGENCICGQVFAEDAKDERQQAIDEADPADDVEADGEGYSYAVRNLFGEANSWITTLVPKSGGYRAARVARALGFLDDWNADFGVPVYFSELQDAWTDYLAEQGID